MNAPTPVSKCFDNTRLSTYKNCPREYFIRHILGWRPDGTATPLVFGLAWHEGMSAMWKSAKLLPRPQVVELAQFAFKQEWGNWGLPETISLADDSYYQPRTPGNAHEMFDNYSIARWRMLQDAELLADEQPFAVPMPGLDDVWYVGRLDKSVNYNGQTLILEHKTTTAYAIVGNFRTDYVDSWYASSQVKGYQFGGGLYYPHLDAVWVDAALVHRKIHDAFKFIPISHNIELLKEWIQDTRAWINRILLETKLYEEQGDLSGGVFPKNEEHCYGKFGQCGMLDICRTCADPTKLTDVPVGYTHEPWEPFSILKLDELVQQTKE